MSDVQLHMHSWISFISPILYKIQYDLKCFDIISVNNFIHNYFHRSISQVEKPEIVVSPNFLRNSGTFSKPSCLWYIWDDLKVNHFRKRLDSSNSSKNPDKPSKQTNLKTIGKLFSCHRLNSNWCYTFQYFVVFGNRWLWLTMRRCWFGNRNMDFFFQKSRLGRSFDVWQF